MIQVNLSKYSALKLDMSRLNLEDMLMHRVDVVTFLIGIVSKQPVFRATFL